MNKNNILTFKQTIDIYSHEPYVHDTIMLRNSGTSVYRDFGDVEIDNVKDVNIEVINGDTVETGRYLNQLPNKVTVILNFADAITPGGLVNDGASTQEEHICRCSNLYASLTTEIADKFYYAVNAKTKPFGIYTDRVIYSKDVLFLRSGDDYSLLQKPYKMDVITCPAPSACLTVEDAKFIITNRIECIIKSAIINHVDNLILGAWGCGAFGQNPKVVAKAFNTVLHKYKYFDNVVFAIRSCGDDYITKTTNNYSIFKEVFDNGS